MADRVFGHVPGQPVGTTYANRKSASEAGVHRPPQSGICGAADGAESIVVSGGYVDDRDFGQVIIYTGEGGRDANSGRQTRDQELKRGNLGLARNCLDGLPVRVVRGYQGDAAFSPASGYRYDGLFRVDEYWQKPGEDGFLVWQFRLVALDDEALNPPEDAEDPGAPPTPGRVESTYQRIVRSNQVAEKVKKLHDHICQVCGTKLTTPAGPYAEAAHIQALGVPHNGPDVLDNLLCLCPNDHVLFDRGAIFIDLEGIVRDTESRSPIGRLRLQRGHQPTTEYITYHRERFAGIT